MNNLRLLSELLRAEVNLQLARRRTRAANSRLVRAGRLLAERHCERRLARAKMRLERARREDATLAAAARGLHV